MAIQKRVAGDAGLGYDDPNGIEGLDALFPAYPSTAGTGSGDGNAQPAQAPVGGTGYIPPATMETLTAELSSPETPDNPGGNYYGPRWTSTLAREPGWMAEGVTPAGEEYARQFYDDPSRVQAGELGNLLTQLRARGRAEGVRIDETDDPMLDLIVNNRGNLDAVLAELRAMGLDQPTSEWSPSGSGSAGGTGGVLAAGNGRAGAALDGGRSATDDQIRQILAAIQGTNAGNEDVNLSDLTPGDFPTFEVPGENLSPEIDNALIRVLRGEANPLQDEISSALKNLLDPSARESRLNGRLESVRERFARTQQSMIADARNELANRGLIGAGGAVQGPEVLALKRVQEQLAPQFATATRDTINDEMDREDSSLASTLATATGWSNGQVQNLLAAAGTASERQQMLSEVALGVLDRNMAWNKFLAEFGLEREQLEEQIRQGNRDQVNGLLTLFMQWSNGVRGGFV